MLKREEIGIRQRLLENSEGTDEWLPIFDKEYHFDAARYRTDELLLRNQPCDGKLSQRNYSEEWKEVQSFLPKVFGNIWALKLEKLLRR